MISILHVIGLPQDGMAAISDLTPKELTGENGSAVSLIVMQFKKYCANVAFCVRLLTPLLSCFF